MGIMSTLFGGGKPNFMDRPESEKEYSYATAFGLGNRMGGRYKGRGPKGDPIFDYSDTNKPVSRREAATPYAHDLGLMDEAIHGFKKPSLFNQTYKPYNLNESYKSGYNPNEYKAASFNYQGLPEEYGNTAYQAGAKDIRREGAGSLEKTREAIGTRRPGLLLKAAEGNQRNVGEQLGNLNSQIRLQEMADKRDLAVQQQKDQAEENYRAAGFSDAQARARADEDYRASQSRGALESARAGEEFKGYQSRAELEKANADERFRNLTSLYEGGKGQITTQAELQKQAQDQRDRALEYLMEIYKTNLTSRRGAGAKAPGGSGILGGIANVASKVAPLATGS